MKNPFKKSSIVDTVINVGVGGAANVAMDYAVENIDALKSLGLTTVNIIKIGVGAVVGSMVNNKYARAAADGLVTVLGDEEPAVLPLHESPEEGLVRDVALGFQPVVLAQQPHELQELLRSLHLLGGHSAHLGLPDALEHLVAEPLFGRVAV